MTLIGNDELIGIQSLGNEFKPALIERSRRNLLIDVCFWVEHALVRFDFQWNDHTRFNIVKSILEELIWY